MITTETILRLRELAEKANIEQAWFTSIEVEDSDLASVHEDNEFIAACDPATILELLDTLEEYRAALEVIATAAPRDDEHDTAQASNYYRLKDSWNRANAALKGKV
jgi:hypothetical protein